MVRCTVVPGGRGAVLACIACSVALAAAVAGRADPPPVTNVVQPSIHGILAPGNTLTVDTGKWSPDEAYTFTYQWVVCRADLQSCSSNSFDPTFALTSAASGCRIAVIIDASSGGVTGSAFSEPTDPVAPGGTCDVAAFAPPPSPPPPWSPPPPPPVIAASFAFVAGPLPPATIGVEYVQQVANVSTAGRPAVAAGELPPRMAFSGDGQLLGTPTVAGTYSFTLQLTDPFTGASTQHAYTLVVEEPQATTPPATPLSPPRADRQLTPGALDPAVTPRMIRNTICRLRWLAGRQAPGAYLAKLKRRQMVQYEELESASHYVEDALVPVELGGASRDARNLWPEDARRARTNNVLERSLRRRVCAGGLSLPAAQREIVLVKRSKG